MQVKFENATFADAVKKASRVAPTKGEAFDKASGILMQMSAEDDTVTFRSTNLSVFYLEVVDTVSVESDGMWRVNASVFADMAGQLPIGSGKEVTLTQDGNTLVVKSGKMTAKFRLMDASYYPVWDPFSPDNLEMVSDLGARLQQVEWAGVEDHADPLAGIHLNGEVAVATDRTKFAVVPCDIEPLGRPVTIPVKVLRPVMTNLRDVAIGIEENHFCLMPDPATQIRTVIYDRQYPDVLKALRFEYNYQIALRKVDVISTMDRAMVFAKRDRTPKITLSFGKQELAFMCEEEDMGLLGDVLDAVEADHKRVHMHYNPTFLKDAINAAPSDEIILHYNTENKKVPLKIDGGSGYIALVMPRGDANKSDG